MANNINWGKIYDTTYWGVGVTTNTISWGKTYSDLSGGSVTPSFALDFNTIADDFTFTRNTTSTFLNENGLIETSTANTPRIDYSTGEGAFLLEPQSTNLITESEDLGSGWNAYGSPIRTGGQDDLSGGTTAYEIEFPTANDFIRKTGVNTNGTFTASVYAKKSVGDTFFFNVDGKIGRYNFATESFTAGTGSPTGEMINVGNGWYRCTMTFTSVSVSSQVRLQSSDGSAVVLWGVQLEELPYATSYIPTSGSTVTRSAETCLDGIVSANSLEGVLYWEGSSDSNSTMIMTELSQGDITNRVSTYIQSSDARGSIRINGSQKNLTGGGSLVTAKKLAVVWSNNIVSFWVNGSQIDTDTYVGSIPEGVLTDLNFAQVGGAAPFYGNTKDLRIYDKALTDEELTELTTI